MPVFQDVAPRHTIFTASWMTPLWDSTTGHSPSGNELTPFFQKDGCFSGRSTLAEKFHFILCHPSLGLSNSSLSLRQRAHPFLSGRIMSQGLFSNSFIKMETLALVFFYEFCKISEKTPF